MVLIGFSKTNSLLSRAIRFFTGSQTSHAFLLTDVYGQPLVMDASPGGVRFVSYEDFKKHNVVVRLIDPPGVDELDWTQVSNYLGKRYDFGGLVGMLIVLVGTWLRLKIKNPFHSTKNMFCSELIVEILQDAGYPGADQLDASATSPQALMEFLEK